MYTALLVWCFVKLTQLIPSGLDPVSVNMFLHVHRRYHGGRGGSPLSLIGHCNRILVTAVEVSCQAIRPILRDPEDSL